MKLYKIASAATLGLALCPSVVWAGLVSAGSNPTGSTIDKFVWQAQTGATQYRLQFQGGVRPQYNAGTRLNALVGQLPLDPSGNTSYKVRLKWRDSSGTMQVEPWSSATVFQAASTPVLELPTGSGGGLGRSASFVWAALGSSVERVKLKVTHSQSGSYDDGSAPDVFNSADLGSSFVPTYRRSLDVKNLPLDGTPITVKFGWRTSVGWQWEADQVFSSGYPVYGIWGSCTPLPSGGLGIRPGKLGNDHTIYSVLHNRGKLKTYPTALHNNSDSVIRDGCASDTQYLSLSTLDVLVDDDEKGLLLWLAKDSGVAAIDVEQWSVGGLTPGLLHTLQPDDGSAQPVFLSLGAAQAWRLNIRSLDPAKPVKISEVRMARNSDDVSSLRKTRFSGSGSFAAVNDDPRARVTAELDRLFGPRFVAAEGWFPNPATCGNYRWLDATGLIPNNGLLVKDGVAWVNWDLVSNTEIHSAVLSSITPITNHYYISCTPAMGNWPVMLQNWQGQAAIVPPTGGASSGGQSYTWPELAP